MKEVAPAPDGVLYRGVRSQGLAGVSRSLAGRTVPLDHRVLHAPGGFEWGFSGCGPSDLARSLLWDVLGAEPPETLYLRFAFDVIARLQNDEWTIGARDVREWLAVVTP